MSKISPDQFFFTLDDFKRLFLKNSRSYVKIAGICFCCALAWKISHAPIFKAEAKYKKSTQNQEFPSSLKSVLSFLPLTNVQQNAVSIMKSKTFLKLVVEDLGLQMRVQEKGLVRKVLSNIGENVSGELRKKIFCLPNFSFAHVNYEGRKPLNFALRFREGGEFDVLDSLGEIKVQSRIGSLVVFQSASFIVESVPEDLVFRKVYKVSISPWEEAVEEIQKSFSVKDDKQDAEVLNLSFISSNQNLSSAFLNYTMQKYTDFVRNEKSELAQQHLTFLEERKHELEETFARFLEEHANYLKGAIEKEGFMGLKQEMETLEKPNEDYHTKLYEVELELNRLKPVLRLAKEQKESDSKSTEAKDPATSKKQGLVALERNHKRQTQESGLLLHEKLNAYLRGKSSDKLNAKSEILAYADSFLKEDLEALQKCKEQTIFFMDSLEQKKMLVENESAQSFSIPILVNLVSQIKEEEKTYLKADEENKLILKKSLEDRKTNLKGFLSDFVVFLERKRDAILEQQLADGTQSFELQGLNPETAQQLYLEYNHELDAVKLNIKQLAYLKEQIYDPNVELSSLCNLLTDPISQQMISKAGEMSLELRDDQNRSLKEHERLKDSLSTQKRFLLHHITQMIDMQKMRAKLIEEKILSLQQSSVDLLSTEKELIEERLGDLRKKMSTSLPQKWRVENLLQLKKDLFLNMIAGIAQLEESKRVEQNILPSGFKVIDLALIPKKAERPNLLFYSFLIAFFAVMVRFCYDFFRRASQGSPISIDLLKHYQFHHCGEISTYADAPLGELKQEDLETLRRISHFAYLQKPSSEGLCLTLLGSGNTNYSSNLAGLLSQRGVKVLLIDSTFAGISSSQSARGLLAFLKGEVDSPLIHRQNSYDFIYSGGYSRNFVELLSQKKLQDFILDRKKEYDFVVIHSHAGSTSVEALIYQSLSDVCVVAAGFEDSIEDLESLLEWKTNKKRDCLTFVLTES